MNFPWSPTVSVLQVKVNYCSCQNTSFTVLQCSSIYDTPLPPRDVMTPDLHVPITMDRSRLDVMLTFRWQIMCDYIMGTDRSLMLQARYPVGKDVARRGPVNGSCIREVRMQLIWCDRESPILEQAGLRLAPKATESMSLPPREETWGLISWWKTFKGAGGKWLSTFPLKKARNF